jgi:hypothetical protein
MPLVDRSQRANAGPDQSSLDFRSSSAATQTIQLARGQTISRTLFVPGSVDACWSRFEEAQGRYRQDILGRIIGLDNGVGITCTRTGVRRLVQGEHRPDCGLVAHPCYGCRTPESARRVAEVSREGRAGPHPVGVMRVPERWMQRWLQVPA